MTPATETLESLRASLASTRRAHARFVASGDDRHAAIAEDLEREIRAEIVARGAELEADAHV